MRRRWVVGVILFLSLALNLVVLGRLAGRHWSHRGGHSLQMVMRRLESLPETERGKARELLNQRRPELKSAFEAVRSSRAQVIEYLGSNEYRRDEAERRLTELREKSSAAQAGAQRLVLDVADLLQPEQRRRFLRDLPGLNR